MIGFINMFVVLPLILMAGLLGLGVGDVSFTTYASCLGVVITLVLAPIYAVRSLINEQTMTLTTVLMYFNGQLPESGDGDE